MKNPFHASALARIGTRASMLGVLIPILFAAAVLVEWGARPERGAEALYAAAWSNEQRVLREAIAGLADVDARDHCGYTPLGMMAASGRCDAVQMLLARGAAVDAPHPRLGTPLMLALRNGDVEVARLLLARGADVNFRCDGLDPLASAVAANSVECVDLVLAAGADLHATGRRYNLLTLAVQMDDVAVMRRLLALGVDPNLADADGTTPLINAVDGDATESVQLLLLAGADVARAGAHGATAHDVAQRRRCGGVIELLKSANNK